MRRHGITASTFEYDALFEKLSELALTAPDAQPLSGDVFLFFGRDRAQVKILHWHVDGYILYQKRLKEGTFELPRFKPGERWMTHRHLIRYGYSLPDESYFTALEVGPRAMQENRKSSKVYVWCAHARHLNLVHFFYEKGSRATSMLTDYIPRIYKCALQSDGLAGYKILETDDYPHTLHLTCWQHYKRDFFDIKDNPDAQKIERTMRYISLSRRSSLFFGSHEGAKRSTLFLSLACLCRLHGIDTFEYFKYLIDTMSQMTQKKDPQFLRNLLPDKYKA